MGFLGAYGVLGCADTSSTVQPSIVPADVTTRYTQFATVPVERIQLFIYDSVEQFNVARWGALFQKGQLLYVAHQLAMEARAAANGGQGAYIDATTGKRAGGVSVNRDGALIKEIADNPLMATYYGQEFLRLRRMIGLGAVCV